MDSGQRDFSILKEPRGFLRIMQLALAILAFSLTVGYSVSTKFSVSCPGTTVDKIHTLNFEYPFNIHDDSPVKRPLCTKNKSDVPKPEKFLFGNYSHHSQFFVFIGVTSMIYSLVILLVYIFFSDWYNHEQTPKWDFTLMAFWTGAWFIASVIWASGQSQLIQYTAPERIFIELSCTSNAGTNGLCKSIEAPGFATLAISALFGFLSSCLSGVTMWFLWKETTWARSRQYTSDLNDHTADGSPF